MYSCLSFHLYGEGSLGGQLAKFLLLVHGVDIAEEGHRLDCNSLAIRRRVDLPILHIFTPDLHRAAMRFGQPEISLPFASNPEQVIILGIGDNLDLTLDKGHNGQQSFVVQFQIVLDVGVDHQIGQLLVVELEIRVVAEAQGELGFALYVQVDCQLVWIGLQLLGVRVNVWVKAGSYAGISFTGLAITFIQFYPFYTCKCMGRLTAIPWRPIPLPSLKTGGVYGGCSFSSRLTQGYITQLPDPRSSQGYRPSMTVTPFSTSLRMRAPVGLIYRQLSYDSSIFWDSSWACIGNWEQDTNYNGYRSGLVSVHCKATSLNA